MTCQDQLRWRGWVFIAYGIIATLIAGCAGPPIESPLPLDADTVQTFPYPIPVATQLTPSYPQPAEPELSAPPPAYPAPSQPSGTQPPVFEVIPLTEEPMIEPAQPTPQDPYSASLVQTARADLSSRLKVNPGDIEFLSYEMVVWPDGGLGCPTPGMAYIQIQVDGYKIRLGYAGSEYAYHGGGTRAPFLCENN